MDEGISEEVLYVKLHAFTDIKMIKVPREIETKRSKGYAFVQFSKPGEDQRMRKLLNDKVFLEKRVQISLMRNFKSIDK